MPKKKRLKKRKKKRFKLKSRKKTTKKRASFKKRLSRKKIKVKRKNLKKSKKKKTSKLRISYNSKNLMLKIIRLQDKFTPKFKFKFDLDKILQGFFQGIADKIDEFKAIKEKEDERRKLNKLKEMEKEKSEIAKREKIEKQLALQIKQKELKDEIKIEKERKKDLHKFIRLEQALVLKEQAEKQRKFLEGIKLEKKIEKFRQREAHEIQKLEKFVLNQERESYAGVQERIDAIRQKYAALRDQQIRERIEQLGVQVTDSDSRAELLEKERQYNLDREKITFALESYYRSMASCVFQLNRRWLPKKMSLLRVIDKRWESNEIFIKFDEDSDDSWLLLVYLKDNNPNSEIIVEDKTNPEKNISNEYKGNEIFKFSDFLVDSLTNLLDREIKKQKTN